MGLETTTHISGLDKNWPAGIDGLDKGDDHIRLLKQVLQDQFPGVGGSGFAIPITATEAEINFLSGVTSAIQDQIDANTALTNAISVPVGGIVMFNAAFTSIPSQFQLCDGTNGTPDMTDKFVYGTNTEGELLDTGGTADAVTISHDHTTSSDGLHTHNTISNHTHTITHTHSIAHNHASVTSGSGGAHRHGINVNTDESGNPTMITAGDDGGSSGGLFTNYESSHTHSVNLPNFTGNSGGSSSANSGSSGGHTHSTAGTQHTHTVNSSGVSGTDLNIPPYVKLAYIQRMS